MTALTVPMVGFWAFVQVAVPDLQVCERLLGQDQFSWFPLNLLAESLIYLAYWFQIPFPLKAMQGLYV